MVDKKKFAEEEALGYQIDVIGRNFQVTEPIRKHVWDKISKIERFHSHIMYMHITLEIHKMENACTIIAKFDHFKVKSHASSSDMYASIDRAIDRLQKLLSRYKSRIQDYHQKRASHSEMQINVLQRPFIDTEEANAAIEEENKVREMQTLRPPEIVGKETKPLKTLRVDEAVMKMDLSGDHFLIFRAEEDQRIKVLYRRTDGHYGLVQPE
ncbi:MAG: ribosome-associated translation inhibitor RaiA [Verrucomicrobia bacterium]|nr:ribosome-associated translation inhibitor RaiA [Verrucomicrobiota bacterium]